MISKISCANIANNAMKKAPSFKSGTMMETIHVPQKPVPLTSKEGVKLLNYYTPNLRSYRLEGHDQKNDVITFRKKEPDSLTDIKFTVTPGVNNVEKVEIDHKSPARDLSIEFVLEDGTKEQEDANNLFKELPS
ncbi:MAG: hypothetical protein A2Y25_00550 [Candidatus Melainabacteria bacterium GWF2_37_15]|nr:MAG: hypothetical protein A2Y25_00550 [Candidatus Melainabacteria bacterium GWF2_37_15]